MKTSMHFLELIREAETSEVLQDIQQEYMEGASEYSPDEREAIECKILDRSLQITRASFLLIRAEFSEDLAELISEDIQKALTEEKITGRDRARILHSIRERLASVVFSGSCDSCGRFQDLSLPYATSGAALCSHCIEVGDEPLW